MLLKDFLNDYFKSNVLPNDEGIYSFFIAVKNGEVTLVNTELDDSKVIVIECDEENFIAISYVIDARLIFYLEGTKLSGADVLDNQYQDQDGNDIIEKGLIFHSEFWKKRYLRIDFYPSIVASMEIDYEQYETDEEGKIIWE